MDNDGGIQWYQEAGVQQEYEAYLDATQPEKEMPKIGEMMESKYLKQSDVEDEVIVTIAKIGKGNIAKENDEPEYKWMIKFNEFKKPMVLNSTNIKRLARACGSEDSDDWAGKQVVLYVDPDVEFAGNVVGGLRIKAVRQEPAEPRRQAAKPTGSTFDQMDDDIPF